MPTISLSPEKERFIAKRGHVIAIGGPGSGKTTAALIRAGVILENHNLRKGQSVLFLSFARATIARVIESSKRIGLSERTRENIIIQTYHSFFWDILKASGYLLNGVRPTTILTPHDASAIMAGIEGREERDRYKETLFEETGKLHFDLFARKCTEILSRSESIRSIMMSPRI